jgi:hypothetical protein
MTNSFGSAIISCHYNKRTKQFVAYQKMEEKSYSYVPGIVGGLLWEG